MQVLPVFFDLETTNLNANYGRLLCGCVKPYGQDAKVFRCDMSPSYKKEPWNDRVVAMKIRDALEGSYQIYAYNSVMFDVKFLNTRLMKHGERVLQTPMHKDLLFTAKRAFALSDNRLATIEEFLNLAHQKTRLDPEIWVRATAGDTKSLDYIVDHCEKDCQVLEDLFEKLIPFIGQIYKG